MIRREGDRLVCQAHPEADLPTERSAVAHLRDEHPSMWGMAKQVVDATVAEARAASPIWTPPAGGWPSLRAGVDKAVNDALGPPPARKARR